MALGTRHPAQERSKKIASTTVFLGRLTGSPPLCTIGCAPMLTLMLDPASRRTVRPAVVTTAALTAAAPAAAPQLSLVVASSRVTSRVVAESRVLVAHQWLHDGWHCGRSECAAQGTCDVLVQRRVVLAQHRGAPGICWTAQIGSQAATTTITTAAPPAASFFLRSSNG